MQQTATSRALWLGMSAAGLLLAASGCSLERARPEPEALCPTWQDDVAEPIAEACGGCHEGKSPGGGYDLGSYEGALGAGAGGEPNAAAGDPSSPLLREVDPELAEPPHEGAADPELFALLERWVVSCDLAYVASRIHERGLMNPRDGDFHGALVRELGYDFGTCAECHGEDFEGGVSEVSCTSCHAEGPTDCATCHGDLPAPHAAHLANGPLAGAYGCEACHPTPADYRDPGHIFGPSGEIEGAPADVELGALANHTPPDAQRAGPAAYDPETRTCANVYCHGDVGADPAATLTAPAWTADAGQAACGTCHGVPPADHASSRCGSCHPTLPRDGSSGPDRALHVSGEVDLHGGDAECAGCHGREDFGAPPPDLAGRTSTALVTVGAHRAHVLAPRGLSAPIPCAACHEVPTELESPGHIDTEQPAEVFPPGHDSLAYAGGAEPAWDPAVATCSDVYCHGGGSLASDGAAGIDRTPIWTAVGDGEAACGRCHGVPPADADHEPELGLQDCHDCHGDTVDEFGNIVVTGPPGARASAHMNGAIDVP